MLNHYHLNRLDIQSLKKFKRYRSSKKCLQIGQLSKKQTYNSYNHHQIRVVRVGQTLICLLKQNNAQPACPNNSLWCPCHVGTSQSATTVGSISETLTKYSVLFAKGNAVEYIICRRAIPTIQNNTGQTISTEYLL